MGGTGTDQHEVVDSGSFYLGFVLVLQRASDQLAITPGTKTTHLQFHHSTYKVATHVSSKVAREVHNHTRKTIGFRQRLKRTCKKDEDEGGTMEQWKAGSRVRRLGKHIEKRGAK